MTAKQTIKAINKAIKTIKGMSAKNQFFCECEEIDGVKIIYVSNGHLILSIPEMPGVDLSEIEKNLDNVKTDHLICSRYIKQIHEADKNAARATTFSIDTINGKSARIYRTASVRGKVSYILIDNVYHELLNILGFSDIQAMDDKPEKSPIIGADDLASGFELMILPIHQARSVADIATDIFPIKFEAVI